MNSNHSERRRAARGCKAPTLDAGWRSVRQRKALSAPRPIPRRAGGSATNRHHLHGCALDIGQSVYVGPSSVKGPWNKWGDPLAGGTVYAAKALDRPGSPAGNASALGCGVASSLRTPCRQRITTGYRRHLIAVDSGPRGHDGSACHAQARENDRARLNRPEDAVRQTRGAGRRTADLAVCHVSVVLTGGHGHPVAWNGIPAALRPVTLRRKFSF